VKGFQTFDNDFNLKIAAVWRTAPPLIGILFQPNNKMPSFKPFSSGRQASHLHTPETTPLRKRENDSFASPEAPLLWRHPLQPATVGLDSTGSYYSPSMSSNFAELNFPHMTRRDGGRRHGRQKHGAQFWIPWLMKGILASPLVVVLLWFVVVTVRHPHESTSMKSNRYGASAPNTRNLLKSPFRPFLSTQQQRAHNAGTDRKVLPFYVPLGASQNEEPQQDLLPQQIQLQAQQQFMIPQIDAPETSMKASTPMGVNGQQQQEYSQFAQAQPQIILPPSQEQGPYMMVGQNMMQLTQQRPGQLYHAQQPQLQAQPLMLLQGQMQLPQQQMQYAQLPMQMQQAQPQMQMLQVQPQVQMQEEPSVMEIQQLQQESPPIMMYPRGSHGQNQRPAHPSKLGNLRGARTMLKANQQQQSQAKVYYYDPAHAIVQGRLQAPTVVYDEHGNVIELASLVTGMTELYMESPLLANAPPFGSTRSSNGTSGSNSTGPLGPLLPPPPLEMKFKTPESWGQSTAQDQSIIVCTVAVMALLVGALSARRLRARSFLSSCIENESLEDEAAFDSAYTINGGDSYNTFGWKGDLEKFDV
jgi:hypothetical protein